MIDLKYLVVLTDEGSSTYTPVNEELWRFIQSRSNGISEDTVDRLARQGHPNDIKEQKEYKEWVLENFTDRETDNDRALMIQGFAKTHYGVKEYLEWAKEKQFFPSNTYEGYTY